MTGILAYTSCCLRRSLVALFTCRLPVYIASSFSLAMFGIVESLRGSAKSMDKDFRGSNYSEFAFKLTLSLTDHSANAIYASLILGLTRIFIFRRIEKHELLYFECCNVSTKAVASKRMRKRSRHFAELPEKCNVTGRNWLGWFSENFLYSSWPVITVLILQTYAFYISFHIPFFRLTFFASLSKLYKRFGDIFVFLRPKVGRQREREFGKSIGFDRCWVKWKIVGYYRLFMNIL